MTAGPGFVWLDGSLRPAEASISVFDRGLLLGDGVFETLRARKGVAVELAEHLARLDRSARTLRMGLPDDLGATLTGAIRTLLAAERLDGPDGDAAVRITLTRGAATSRGLLPPPVQGSPSILVQAWPHQRPDPALAARGLRLAVAQARCDPLDPLAGAKTTSRAGRVHARIAAAESGADDALFLTTDGRLCETTMANVFLVVDGELRTPSSGCGILLGITRGWVLRWAADHGVGALECDLTLDQVRSADEVFVSSSLAGIAPVSQVGDVMVGRGRPGPVAQRIGEAREAFVVGHRRAARSRTVQEP